MKDETFEDLKLLHILIANSPYEQELIQMSSRLIAVIQDNNQLAAIFDDCRKASEFNQTAFLALSKPQKEALLAFFEYVYFARDDFIGRH